MKTLIYIKNIKQLLQILPSAPLCRKCFPDEYCAGKLDQVSTVVQSCTTCICLLSYRGTTDELVFRGRSITVAQLLRFLARNVTDPVQNNALMLSLTRCLLYQRRD